MANTETLPTGDLRAHVCAGLFPGERLYAIVDGARDLELAHVARDRFGQEILSLFDEPGATRLARVAPYLVPIGLDSEYLDVWAGRLGSRAGILVLSAICVPELRAHLRRLFVVTDDWGEEYFFRFYDPRVLRVYLPTCNEQETREFLGPIRRVVVESEDRGLIRTYELDHNGMKITDRPLSPTGETTDQGRARR